MAEGSRVSDFCYTNDIKSVFKKPKVEVKQEDFKEYEQHGMFVGNENSTPIEQKTENSRRGRKRPHIRNRDANFVENIQNR